MRRAFGLLVAGAALCACTSDPNAAVNQMPPIQQMDQFFNSLSPQRAAGPQDYTHVPGYAPAYPPYDNNPGP